MLCLARAVLFGGREAESPDVQGVGGTWPERTTCLGQHQAKRKQEDQQSQNYGESAPERQT